jgi:precorrin-6x reductase
VRLSGKLYLVSTGPGDPSLIPPFAQAALHASEAIVGYELYLRWIGPWIAGKEIYTPPLTREQERAALAIELARGGKTVSLVSGGDIGVYAMAALAFEELREDDDVEVQVIPGITAANACASLLGSPLSHDFATLSLSDLLCPWEWIETRARHIAQADLACVLYNVQSGNRREGVYKVLRSMLEHKRPDTLCGVVRNAYRPDQTVEIATLRDLLLREFDMLTTLVIGNRFTQRKGKWIFTPRGYNDWDPRRAEGAPTGPAAPRDALWVFSGTSDGNHLATSLTARGHTVIVSVASDYGRDCAGASMPGIHIVSGNLGVAARRRLMHQAGARAIVDATHPYAAEMSRQLLSLSTDLELPYFRFERPSALLETAGVIQCATMPDAARMAIERGRRIFLATGSKGLSTFVNTPGASEREWFVRITPQGDMIDAAVRLCVPRAHVCAMQGPFTREFNEALWKAWNIDLVITKDSGDAGGFPAKLDAARALGLPLLVVKRPSSAIQNHYVDDASMIAAIESRLGKSNRV